MTVTLEPGVDLRDIKQRIGVGRNEELRESEKRRRYLQGFSRLITPLRPSLRLTGRIPTAMVNQDPDDADQPRVLLTTRQFDQPATDYSQRVFDLIMQEALTVHEIGHILYTDHEDATSYLSRADLDRKAMYKRVWNTLEDAAIEEQLRREWDVREEVLVMNANLFEPDEIGHTITEGSVDEADPAIDADERGATMSFSFFQAVVLGLLDMGVYDSGKFAALRDPDNDRVRLAEDADRDLLDEFVPEMKAVVQDVKTTPDSTHRNERIWAFWEDLAERLDDAQNSGENESNLSDLLGADGSVDASASDGDGENDEAGDGETGANPMDGKPDDTGNHSPTDAREAIELSMDATEEDVSAQVAMAAGDPQADQDAGDDESEAGEDAGEAGDGDGESEAGDGGRDTERLRPDELQDRGGDGGDGDDGGGDGAEMDGQDWTEEAGRPAAGSDGDSDGDEGQTRREEMEEMYQQELAAEAAELDGGEALLDEIEQFLEIIEAADADADAQGGEAGGSGFEGLTMEIPEPNGYDRDKWTTVKRKGKRIARILRNRLQQNQQNQPKRRRKKGSFDRRQMINAERGSPRVFSQTQEDTLKDYDAIFVLDRSGSMSGTKVEHAELALGELAYAFELLGITTAVLDLHGNEARLAHAFGQSLEETRGVLFSGVSGGGTPLSQVLHLARKRVTIEDSNPFMVVVTDGKPADHETYREELDNCTFPVLGVYVGGDNRRDDESYFHRQVDVTNESEIDTTLTHLAEEVIDEALVDLSQGVSF